MQLHINTRAARVIACGLLVASFTPLLLAQAGMGSTGRNPQGMIRTQNAFPTGNTATSMILLERATPAEVRVGNPFTYEIHIKNLTQKAIPNIVVTEELPLDFTVEAIQPEPDAQEGRRVRWTLAQLGGGQTKVMSIRGVPSRLGQLEPCNTVAFSTQLCHVTKVVEPALKLVKTAPAEVILCDTIPLTFKVTNAGSGTAQDVVITDTLPEGWATTDGKTNLRMNVGTLAAGQSRDFATSVKSTKTGKFINTAMASESGGMKASASTETIVRQPMLTITKTGPQMRYLGRPATYEMTVRNTGDAPAKNTVLVDTIDVGARFTEASDQGQASGGKVTWNLGTLEPGTSRSVTVTLVMTQRKTVSNTATVTAYCAQASTSASTVVKGIPALLLEVVDVEDPIEVGSNVTYIIAITNQGSAEGENIAIQCELPEEQEFVSAEGPTPDTIKGKIVTFAPLPSLDVKAKVSYRVVVKGIEANDVRFKVIMTGAQLITPVQETESTHIYQ